PSHLHCPKCKLKNAKCKFQNELRPEDSFVNFSLFISFYIFHCIKKGGLAAAAQSSGTTQTLTYPHPSATP
ncbi:hypothetical protein KAX22_01760, partial [bacterium]|nr:hypothetical protein [bacterium]